METCLIARSRCNAEELGAPLSSHCPRHFEADDIGLPLKVATTSRRMAYASGIPTHWWKSWACGTRQTIRHRSKSDTSCLPAGYRLQLCQHLFKPHPQINKHMAASYDLRRPTCIAAAVPPTRTASGNCRWSRAAAVRTRSPVRKLFFAAGQSSSRNDTVARMGRGYWHCTPVRLYQATTPGRCNPAAT